MKTFANGLVLLCGFVFFFFKFNAYLALFLNNWIKYNKWSYVSFILKTNMEENKCECFKAVMEFSKCIFFCGLALLRGNSTLIHVGLYMCF